MIGGFPIAYSPIAGTTIPVKSGVANWFIGESATNWFDTSDSCNTFTTDKSDNEFVVDQSRNSITLTV